MWNGTPGGIAFFASLLVLVVCLQAMLLLAMPTIALLRAAASILYVVAAAASYFCNAYGAVMDKDMMRNVFETDVAEVRALVSGDLVISLVILGVLPAILLWRVSLPSVGWSRRLRQRAAFFVSALLVCAGGSYACSASYAVFLREHKEIRLALIPAAPVSSIARLMGSGAHETRGPLLNPAGISVRTEVSQQRPLVVFIVVGETARAENFQLGGYARPTTPRLQAIGNLAYLGPASACGTSTALSVPCMFSHEGRQNFDLQAARRQTNVLDALVQAGVAVEWRDNNSGCKGVCARVASVSYSEQTDPRLCPQSYCYDEIMLEDLAARLRAVHGDTAIVFHQIGSHGPAYAERYPPEFERFKPACRSNELHECTRQEIVNAYDNTIAYTDHFLARLIALLREASGRVDGMLIYASDHGESLGEQGIYLHGMPYTFAPRAQKEVPMLVWTSPQYDARVGLRTGCLAARAHGTFSHANLYHTILGAARVRNRLYERKLDILAPCRSAESAEAG